MATCGAFTAVTIAILVVTGACGSRIPTQTLTPTATPSARPTQTPAKTTTPAPTTAPSSTPQATAAPTATPSPGLDAIMPVLRLTISEFPSPATIIEPPEFTLYADGRAIYALKSQEPEQFWPSFELHTAQLSGEQVTALVADALGPGGLRDARREYDIPNVFDLSWTSFGVITDEVPAFKEVSVYGLGEYDDAPDHDARSRFLTLQNRLLNFTAEVEAGRAAYLGRFEPAAYDAFIYPSGAADEQPVSADWPWADLEPSDFNSFPDGTLSRRLTHEQGTAVIDLGINSYVIAEAPDGERYTIRLRPLLPDEAAGPILD